MALFGRNYNKPGPGVPKNAPRKRGPARFFEILGRDFGSLLKLNWLFALCALPAEALFVFALASQALGYAVPFYVGMVLAVLAGGLIGPAYTTGCALILKMLRDDPGFFWHDYKRIWRENFRSTVLPGILYTLVAAIQLYVFYHYGTGGLQMGFGMLLVYVVGIFLLAVAAPYYFAQAASIHLSPGKLFKNSFLLAFGFLPRSLMGALLGTGLVVVQLLFLPISLVATVFVGYAIPCLLNMMWIWPPLDKSFHIEETLKKRQQAQYENDDA